MTSLDHVDEDDGGELALFAGGPFGLDEEAEADLLKMGGVGIDDMHANPVRTARLRAVWLTVNLATAVLASFVIGQFEGAIEKIVALAVLMPIVASMGEVERALPP